MAEYDPNTNDDDISTSFNPNRTTILDDDNLSAPSDSTQIASINPAFLAKATARAKATKTAKDNEQSATANPISALAGGTDAAKSAEQNQPFANKVQGSKNKDKKTNKSGIFRKIGPSLTVGGISIFAFVGIGAIFSPFLMLNHVITIATEKWSFSEYSLTRRTQQIFGLKATGAKTPVTTGGVFNTNIGNRFRPMTAKTIYRLWANGFELDIGDATKIGNKVKINGISHNGVSYSDAKSFTKALRKDTGMRNSLNKIYKPRVAQMFDKVGEKIKSKFNLKKFFSGAPKNADSKNMLTALQNETKSSQQINASANNSARQAVDPDNPNATTPSPDGASSAVRDIDSNLKRAPALSGKASATNILKSLNVLGAAQMFCGYYQMAHGFAGMVKTSGLDQIMTSVAKAFSVGDQIKEGHGDSAAISAINTALVTPTTYPVTETDDNGKLVESTSRPQTGSAAQAYLYANQVTNISRQDQIDGSTSQYLMGGIPPFFQGLYYTLNSDGGEIVSKVCKVMTNPVVVGATTVLSIGLALLTAGSVNTVLAAIQGVPIMAMNVGLNLILPTIASIAAGDTSCMFAKGQDMMNCLMIGFGGMAGKLAGGGGNTALTNNDAISMYIDHQQYLAEVAAEERASRSPFDTSSHHTFLGSIVHSFSSQLDQSSFASSLNSTFASLASVVSSSVSTFVPGASAFVFDLATFKDSLNVCDDNAYKNIATDPFCNPIYGVNNLELDAEDVLSRLMNSKQLWVSEDGLTTEIQETFYTTVDEEGTCTNQYDFRSPYGNGVCDTGQATGLAAYRDHCYNRRAPLMMTVDGDRTGNGHDCISGYTFNNPTGSMENNIYALYFIDDRVQEAIDGNGLVGLSDEFLETAYNKNIPYFISDNPTSNMYIAGYYDNDSYEPDATDIAYAAYVEQQENNSIAYFEDIIEQAYIATSRSTEVVATHAPIEHISFPDNKLHGLQHVLYAPSIAPPLSKPKQTQTTI